MIESEQCATRPADITDFLRQGFRDGDGIRKIIKLNESTVLHHWFLGRAS